MDYEEKLKSLLCQLRARMQGVILYVLDCGVGEPSLIDKFAGRLTRVLNTGDSVII